MTTVAGGHGGGCGGGGGCSDGFSLMSRLQGYEYCCSESCLGYDLVVVGPMAEDESRTESVNEAGSSSKDVQDEREEGWLQLGIGSHMTSHDNKPEDQLDQTTRRASLIELDLLPSGGSSQHVRSLPPPVFHMPEFRAPRPVSNITSASFLSQRAAISTFPHHQEINWAFRPMARNLTVAVPSSSSSSSLMPPGSYFTRPFQLHAGVDVPAGPSLDFRIVDPPRRPHSGIWFMLQASQNQSKEPFLPQIPKSYLRIKDGRMTVRLLMKYLVNKLRLDSESEIEITCRGQQLLPFLTLQHVRDNIWSPRNALTLLPDSSTTDHVMVLHYSRSA
ncbi:hypothetical protein CsSME_00036636 [Camellia sinensis var. sinensis]|uniref:Uncharacterized protein n=1 Tax=Camellia sinensis TaxID=4442 RepID=A0A7J7G277_CAMSI|nr:uncharacterized protein LOC114283513 isoform X2 [Camellia sinensis]KAF5934830.1 hypothetical protein HYC85_025959 [Camellia sinensis]